MFEYFNSKSGSKVVYFLIAIAIIISTIILVQVRGSDKGPKLSPYPFGANFAFTITEDPDSGWLNETKLVYDFLKKKGLRTTIAVWVKKATRSNGIPDLPKPKRFGVTCENPKYLEYVQLLQREGFEVALHGVSGGNDRRAVTVKGYENFKLWFGIYPKMNIMHAQNLENVYWGKKVVSNKVAQFLIGSFVERAEIPFSGEDPSSKYFWGDILQQKTKYVRLFGSRDINTLRFNPTMPYHDQEKHYVNYWFSYSDGFGVDGFNDLISQDHVDKLIRERGACIAYTHFAHGFVRDGKLNETFKRRIDYLASQPDGWFVPASDILDRLLLMKKVILLKGQDGLMVVNLNHIKIEGVTVIVPPGQVWYGLDGKKYDVNDGGEIILETLEPGRAIVLLNDKSYTLKKEQRLGSPENGITFVDFEDAIYIVRKNNIKFTKVSVQIISGQTLFNISGQKVLLTKGGQIPDSAWDGGKEIVLFKNKGVLSPKNQRRGKWESFNMVLQRALLYLKQNKIFDGSTT